MARGQRKRKRSLPDQSPGSNRPKKYRKWNEESMREAIQAVTEGKLAVNRAADQYTIPRSTLKDIECLRGMGISLGLSHTCRMKKINN